jgi:hypothetical protein
VNCLLHIGTHKTGTTSIQHFLRQHVGVPSYPMGLLHPDSHSELAGIAARRERADMLTTAPQWVDDSGREQVARHVRAQVTSDVERLIYSSENLSLLCHADEVAAVMHLLRGRDVQVVMYTRNPRDFLASYDFTIRLFGLAPPSRPDAINDVSPGSWLVDYQQRIDLWAQHAPVTVIDYDEVVARDGSVIPTFAGLLGIEPVDYRLNTTDSLRAEIEASLRRDPATLAELHSELAHEPARRE